MNHLIFFALAFLAEVAGTVGGFGSSVFFVPLAGFFFDFKTVLGITAVFHVFSNISKLYLFRKEINKKLLVMIGIPGVVGVIIGAVLSNTLSLEFAEVVLGIFLVAFSILLLSYPRIAISPTKENAIGAGGSAGFLAGLIGTGGAVRGLSLAAFNLDKGMFVGTSAAIDFGVDFSRSVIYSWNGYLTSESLVMIPGLILIAITGSYIGKLILGKFQQETFRKLVLLLILFIGITMIVKFLYGYTTV